MEVTANQPGAPSNDPTAIDEGASKLRQTFGAARRRFKQIDLRQTVIDNPFIAVGIGLAAGAIVGLVRPMPQRGRVTGALMSVAGMLAYRLVKDIAIAQAGIYARDVLGNRDASYSKSRT